MLYYRVNIDRPSPYIEDQNKRLCEYIEPLREQNKVMVNGAYSFNLEQHRQGKACVLSQGGKYMFWFTDRSDAEQFINDWIEELGVLMVPVISKHPSGKSYFDYERTVENYERYKDFLTKIVEEEREFDKSVE